MKLILNLLLFIELAGCRTIQNVPPLADGTILPQRNGYIVYHQADTLNGVTMPEINRVAQLWVNEYTKAYDQEWQPPVFKAELMYAGQFGPESLHAAGSEYYARRRRKVNYF